MSKNERRAGRFLVAVDDSESSERAVAYVAELAEMLGGEIDITLFHLLPALPPELLEHGGAEDPVRETALEEQLVRDREQWVLRAELMARPILEKAKRILKNAHVEERNLHQMFATTVYDRLDIELLEAARERGCGTIVLGRRHHTLFEDLTKTHLSNKLLKEASGMALCVVP